MNITAADQIPITIYIGWNDRSIKRYLFVNADWRFLTGGLNVLDRAFAGLFGAHGLRAFMLGEARVYAVARAALRPD